MNLITFQFLRKNLKKDFSSFPKIKIAILADSATQMYVQAVKGYGYEVKIDFEIFESEYDQIERQIFDSTSDLYRFNPEFVVVFYSTNRLLKKFGKLGLNEKAGFAQSHIENCLNQYNNLSTRLNCKIIYFNFNETEESVFGNFSNKTSYSFNYQLRKINYELMNLSQRQKNLFILDLNILQGLYGHDALTDNKIYVNTDLLFSIDFLPLIAKNTTDIVLSILGKIKKCLILDLDNTLWGGIIGDDGIEKIQIGELGIGKAFSELQLWAKQLRQRGIILAICSKNDESIAKEPFEKHPDMVLRMEDISVFVANWNNKADNIKYIQQILNIGFDSMVFLDDNPFERNLVRTNIPEITVPELPEDPAEYLNFIRKLNLFETASFTNDDIQRTGHYQEEAKREIEHQQYINEADFLASLNMIALVEPFNAFNTPRVAQLTQRSNQFNLRTIRYTEEDIQRIANNSDYLTLAFSLKDKYGDSGLISLVIMKKVAGNSLFVDTWIMSCRVLKRNMENFVLNTMVNLAIEKGYSAIIGEYLPTAKNSMVKDHYRTLGFAINENYWELLAGTYNQKACYIQTK